MALGCAAPPQASIRPVAQPVPTPSRWTLDRSTFDTDAEPCVDFYQHVCGGWVAAATIPDGRDRLARSRAMIDEASAGNLDVLLNGDADAVPGDVSRLRTFYGACMAAGEDSTAVLAPWLARIDGAAPIDEVIRQLHGIGVNVLFRYEGVPNPDDSAAHRGQLQQGRLAIAAASDDSVRPNLTRHIEGWLVKSGLTPEGAAAAAPAVADLELGLAAVALPFAEDEFQTPQTEHPMSLTSVAALTPSIEWDAYIEMVALPRDAIVNVKSPTYFEGLESLLASTKQTTLRSYLRWKLVAAVALDLPPNEDGSARRDACRLSTLRALGVELSRQFALRAMGPEARDGARRVAAAVQTQVIEAARSNVWLSQGARDETATKLEATDLKVGFPERWPATGSFKLVADAHVANVLAARRFEQQRRWQRASAPRSRESWEMLVRPNEAWGMAAARLTIVNGYPDAFSNSIVLPAASVLPPMYDDEAPPEVNYATFGTLVAHELIHVAENYLFDGRGRARTIWSPDDLAAQTEQLSCIVDQANAAGLDGDQTKDENVADLGGLRLAHRAMTKALGPALHEVGADGLSAEQRFFITYAQRWCETMTPEAAAEGLKSDWHAPPRFRVNAIVSSMPQFAEAFECQAPVRSCGVW